MPRPEAQTRARTHILLFLPCLDPVANVSRAPSIIIGASASCTHAGTFFSHIFATCATIEDGNKFQRGRFLPFEFRANLAVRFNNQESRRVVAFHPPRRRENSISPITIRLTARFLPRRSTFSFLGDQSRDCQRGKSNGYVSRNWSRLKRRVRLPE